MDGAERGRWGDPRALLTALCDESSLRGLDGRSGVAFDIVDGVVAALGRIDGREVACYAEDPSHKGGSLGEAHAQTIVRVLDHARRRRTPVIGAVASAGARLQEGVRALDWYGEIFQRMTALGGRVPQIAVATGTAAGGASYMTALSDFVVMDDRARLFLTGPRVVRSAMNEDVSADSLGGVEVHDANGVAHFTASGEQLPSTTRRLLGYLPDPGGGGDPAPVRPARRPSVAGVVPTRRAGAYDVRDLLDAIVDAGAFMEYAAGWAPNMTCGLARLGSQPVGVVANQPRRLGGVIDAAAAEKAAGFVARCDAHAIPLVVLVDTPGFLPGRQEEGRGVIRRGAALVRAFAAATVTKLTVITRKAYGGGYITMSSRGLGADRVYAWTGAQVGIMGAAHAVEIMHGRRLEGAEDPAREHARLGAEYAERQLDVAAAVRAGAVDDVIEPDETRRRLQTDLVALRGPRRDRHHGDERLAAAVRPSATAGARGG